MYFVFINSYTFYVWLLPRCVENSFDNQYVLGLDFMTEFLLLYANGDAYLGCRYADAATGNAYV